MPKQQFWAQKTLEPKRKHRWLLYLKNAQIPSYAIKVVNKPSFSVAESEHSYFGHKFYYPGMLTWNEISITLVDPIDEDATSAINRVIDLGGYKTPDNLEDTSGRLYTLSKAESVDALGPIIKLEQQQAVKNGNVPIEEWKLHNPWIKDVKFGDLDYTSTDLVEVTMTIRYDWAVHKNLVNTD